MTKGNNIFGIKIQKVNMVMFIYSLASLYNWLTGLLTDFYYGSWLSPVEISYLYFMKNSQALVLNPYKAGPTSWILWLPTISLTTAVLWVYAMEEDYTIISCSTNPESEMSSLEWMENEVGQKEKELFQLHSHFSSTHSLGNLWKTHLWDHDVLSENQFPRPLKKICTSPFLILLLHQSLCSLFSHAYCLFPLHCYLDVRILVRLLPWASLG